MNMNKVLLVSRLFLIGALTSLIFACQPPQKSEKYVAQPQSVERSKQAYLEQSYAAMRAQQITDVTYQLKINLDEKNTWYSGEITIDFTLAKQNVSPVTVDFNSGTVKAVYLDNKPVDFIYEQYFIQIAAASFTKEKNTLRIEFEHAYSMAGDGLHRYQDSQTGKVYLYTNFEPYNANKMFPHFDQPNIKASYLLEVLAPASWQVVSAQRESSIRDEKGQKRWSFPITPKIPSYIFPLHAGPYKIWEDKSGKTPLRLFAREELAQYVNAKEWFTFTQQSFDFYNQYFEIEYPFGKYDQLVVPDFNAGAMENLGAVTFNEIYVGRGVKTRLERFRHANVISHELAHMWFGNLVTMDWWNGLWLNESFATYMSYLQQYKNSEFKEDSWRIFYNNMKQWAYTADKQVTTHAIELPVANTSEAFTNFDGITYGKGASVLKQLAYFVGEENFRKGVANYLKKFSYRNTELKDFINEVAQASNQDLTGWTQEWLYLAGLNTVQVEFFCGDNQDVAPLSKFSVLQFATPENPTLRSQKIELGLYQIDQSVNQKAVYQTAIIPFVYSGEKTSMPIEKSMACPDFVYPNVNDMGYLKVSLDNKSFASVQKNIAIFDPEMRSNLWQILWDEVLDKRFQLSEFVQLVDTSMVSNDAADVAAMSAKLRLAHEYFLKMQNNKKGFEKELTLLEKISWRELQAAEKGSDIQKIWFDTYVQLAFSKTELTRLGKLLSGKQKVRGLEIDQDRRWAVLVRLNLFQFDKSATWAEQEKKKDPSDRGQQMSLMCEVVRATPEAKAEFFDKIVAKEQAYKLATARLLMVNLFPVSQIDYRHQYAEKILSSIPKLHQEQDDRFLSAYLTGLSPSVCTAQNVSRLEKAVTEYGALNPVINRALKIAQQEEQRCVDMKEFMLIN